MKYVLTSKKQRIFSFLIDGLIVGGLGYLFGFLIVHFSGLGDYYKSVSAAYTQMASDGTATNADLMHLIGVMLARTGVYAGVYLILTVLYLIVLPLLTEWQTLGRLLFKCRLLVCKKNTKPGLGRLVLREIVGEYLLYIVLTLFLKQWNLAIWLSVIYAVMSGISFPDRIGRLKLVNKDPEEEISMAPEEFQYPEDYDFEKDGQILDASVFEKEDKEENTAEEEKKDEASDVAAEPSAEKKGDESSE